MNKHQQHGEQMKIFLRACSKNLKNSRLKNEQKASSQKTVMTASEIYIEKLLPLWKLSYVVKRFHRNIFRSFHFFFFMSDSEQSSNFIIDTFSGMLFYEFIYLFRFFNQHHSNGKIIAKWQLNSINITNYNFVISK